MKKIGYKITIKKVKTLFLKYSSLSNAIKAKYY